MTNILIWFRQVPHDQMKLLQEWIKQEFPQLLRHGQYSEFLSSCNLLSLEQNVRHQHMGVLFVSLLIKWFSQRFYIQTFAGWSYIAHWLAGQ